MRVLEKNGFQLARQRGSHRIYKQTGGGRIVPVPVHRQNQPLKRGTLQAIIKQSGLDRSVFRD